MSEFYDARETRDPGLRERDLMHALPVAIARAIASAPAIARQLQGVDPRAITTREALAAIPVIRKNELLEAQQHARLTQPSGAGPIERIFGGYSAIGWGQALRVFASPGPIYEPESARSDYWRFARAVYAAGFRAGDLAHNCFSYHFTPAGSMMETAAHAVGCTVFPGGVGQTEQQVQVMHDLAPNGYMGTPSFLKIILEKAEAMGVQLPSLRCALLSGEAFPPSLRGWLSARGVNAYQAYGSADLGMIAYESVAREGLILSEDLLLEIVRPGTQDVVPDGEVGEVVVTTLNPDYPLIRFGTGDLSAIMPGASPCGRTNRRIRGWLGRADQTTKVRGMFVHPGQIAEVARRFPEVARARLVVTGSTGTDLMTLKIEVGTSETGLTQRMQDAVREVTKLRAEIECVAAGTLPNDGKVIEDLRTYQ
jgi:phenylacetate-CoA ligase